MKRNDMWLETIRNQTLPLYDDLPEIELYLDQVLEFVNGTCGHLFGKAVLTRGMVNNYVKQKVMPAPLRKRYSKDHLAYLIAISVLKSVLNIQDVSKGIEEAVKLRGVAGAYDSFIGYAHDGLDKCMALLNGEAVQMEVLESESLQFSLRAIMLAFAAKLVADYSFNELITKERE